MSLFRIGDRGGLLSAALGLLASATLLAQTDEAAALHERIDHLVASGGVAPLAPPAGDFELVRRIYLDFAGRIPAPDEARAFVQSEDPRKLVKLVDELLASHEFAQQMAEIFDLWLMERRGGSHVSAEQWRSYLTESFAANKPLDALAREILAADGSEERIRAASRFYLDRAGEPHLLTRDVGRLFFGKDLQCAQCHDHPNVSDYLQRDYYGLFAFFARTSLFQPDGKKPALLLETADGEATFQSVFTDVKGSMPPRLPDGSEVADPELAEDKRYEVKPDPKDKNVRPVPTYSRRLELARRATDGSNRAFNRNFANRLWGYLMGRCLVDPPDLIHAGNPSAYPDLLDLLATELVALNFDARAFLRELAQTETYRRSFELPGDLPSKAQSLAARLDGLKAEAAARDEAAETADAVFGDARDQWEEAAKALEDARAEMATAHTKRDEAAAAKKTAEESLAKAQEALATEEGKLVVLAEAESGNVEAAKVFPEDKELEEAAAVVARRAEQVRGAVQKLQADAAASEKAAADASAVLTTATAAAEESAGLVEASRAAVEKCEAELDDAHARFVAERSMARHAAARLEQALRLIAYAEAVHVARKSREEAARLGAERTGLENDAAAREEQAADLAEAARRAESAAVLMPDDAELAGAVAVLRDRSARADEQSQAAAEALGKQRAVAEEAAGRAEDAAEKLAALEEEVTELGTGSFALGVFAPLNPEQLCSSTLQATGEWERVRLAAVAEFEKKLAESQAVEAAPETQDGTEAGKKPAPPKLTEADRERFVQEQMRSRLKGAYDKFIRLFGGQPGQPQSEFYATADQALFFENDGLVRGWLRPNGENLTGRLAKIDDPTALAEELYLATLTRLPSDDEKARVEDYLASRESDRAGALQDLAWALISSVEFRFKH